LRVRLFKTFEAGAVHAKRARVNKLKKENQDALFLCLVAVHTQVSITNI